MARPKKFYIFFELGKAMRIIEGCLQARKLNCAKPTFRTRLAAEEFAAWWNYEHKRWFER
jgi:hypothetical protein